MKLGTLSILAAAGLAMACGCSNNCCKTTGEGKETPVALKDVPAAVRATLEKEAAGGKITEVEKEMKDGKTIYSADIESGGKAWDVAVGEDGRLISKELEKAGESEKKPEKK